MQIFLFALIFCRTTEKPVEIHFGSTNHFQILLFCRQCLDRNAIAHLLSILIVVWGGKEVFLVLYRLPFLTFS